VVKLPGAAGASWARWTASSRGAAACLSLTTARTHVPRGNVPRRPGGTVSRCVRRCAAGDRFGEAPSRACESWSRRPWRHHHGVRGGMLTRDPSAKGARSWLLRSAPGARPAWTSARRSGPVKGLCPPASSPTSRPSISCTVPCAPSSTTTFPRPGIPAAPSRRVASSRGSSTMPSSTMSATLTVPMPTSSRTPPATRRWVSTPCGPCATRSPPSARRVSFPPTRAGACASRTSSASAATRSRRRRCSDASGRRRSTGIRRRRRRS